MADVKPLRVRGTDSEPDADRAQLILITGLTLAVILVAVVLLLNTVIYTENLATRGVDAGGAEAVDFRDGAVEDVAAIMYREHGNVSSDSTLDDFRDSTGEYGQTVSELRARDGVVAGVDASVDEPGYFVTQNASVAEGRDMTADDGTTNWTVAGDVTRTRNFQMIVNLSNPTTDDNFSVVADGRVSGGTNETWNMTLSEDGDELNVTVDDGDGSSTKYGPFPSDPDGNYTIDVTGGTVNGKPVNGFRWADGVQEGSTPYDLRYKNSDAAEGTYRLVVDERDGGTGSTSPAPPRVTEAVYSAEVEVYHRTPELEYGDVVRVAPGERDA